MPLYLRPPRKGKTPNYEIRGKYLGIRVEQSAGTDSKKIAGQELRRIKRRIERGEYRPRREEAAADGPLTFAMAAEAYLLAGGESQHLGPILELDGPDAIRHRPIDAIDQPAIDRAAAALYPNATPQTKNRQFYTPVSAVLKRAGDQRKIKRPKGWRGKKAKWSLEPDQAFALLDAAEAVDREFGLLCWLLNYTGMRISEPLRARLGQLKLDRRNAKGEPEPALFLDDSKNDEPRMVYLPPIVVKKFRAMPPRPARIGGRSKTDAGKPFLKRDPNAKLFRFHYGSPLRKMLARAMALAGLSFPPRHRGFHLFCHTYGTWMVHFGSLDNYGLTRTRRWKDPRSAEGYVHTKINAEARRADLLPTPPRGKARGLARCTGQVLEAKASRLAFTRERS
jgi:integrase